jgi:transcription initiation factor TFIIB
MESLDKYFDDLNTMVKVSEKKQERCCDDVKNHTQDNGMILCNVCQNCVTNIVDCPEWRFYGASDSKNSNPTRCGMPVNELLPLSSIGTSISTRGGAKMQKVKTFHTWNSVPYKERSRMKVFLEISEICKRENLPEIIIKESQSLYNIVSQIKISRGSNRKGIIAACVYFACKNVKVGRSINEISAIFSIDSKVLTKGCKQFKEIIEINKKNTKRINSYKSLTMQDFIGRFCSKLKLSGNDVSEINKIVQKCIELGVENENTPPSMAAGCIFLYLKRIKRPYNKQEISEVCKISEVTINKCYKKLECFLKEDSLKKVKTDTE